MKDFIYINYGIKVNKLYKNYFFINDEKIIIQKTNINENEIEKLYSLTNKMYNDKLNVNTFILNKNNKCYTKKENENIVLLKVNDRDCDITLRYLKKYKNHTEKLNNFNLVEYWKNIVDNIEDNIVLFNKEHLLLQDSINYFIGMSENAISLMGEYEYINSDNISHNIKYFNFNKEKFDNPFTFVNASYLYDISNYIKFKFYNNKLDYEEVYYILKEIEDEYDQALFFSCMLYCNFYFDIVNEILNDRCDDKELEIFINKIKEFEELLSYCAKRLKKCKWIALINWFN